MAAAPAWTQKPMPPGWEAKYDQRSRKYFFVNHQTRVTQWVDPRIAYYANQPAAPMMRPPEQIQMRPIVKNKCTSCRMTEVSSPGAICSSCKVEAQRRETALIKAREQREAEQKKRELDERTRKAQEERIRQEQERRRVQSAKRRQPPPTVTETHFGGEEEDHEAPTLTMSEKIKLVNDLQEIYSDVSRSVIDMVLESCSYNKQKAAGVLNSMSKKKWQPGQERGRGATPRRSPAPARAAAAAPRELNVAQKAQARAALKKTFPKASGDLITMALESTNYDKNKAEQVLKFTMTDDDTKAKAKDTAAKAKTKTSTPAASTSISTPSTSSTLTVRSPSPQPKPTTEADKTKKTATRKASPSPSKTARKASPSPVRAARIRQKIATKMEEQTPFESSYSIMAQGSDPSLAQGPNKDLLIDNYVKESGPDTFLVNGPNPDYVMGPSSEMSSKTSGMANGPQASLRSGPQASLVKGSLYQQERQS